MDATHIKNEFELKPLTSQKVQELRDGQKKLDWKEPTSYFAHTKVATYRIWFSPMKSHSELTTRTQAPSLVFIGREVKIYAEYSLENVLKTVLKPWAD